MSIKENVKVELKVVANYAKKTFTIRSVVKGTTLAKYRTNPMSAAEFKEHEYNTPADWANFLKVSDNYYKLF